MHHMTVQTYRVQIRNTRDDFGALRRIHLHAETGEPVTLQFLAGEPMPRVEQRVEDGGRWFISFPLSHYDAILDVLRNEAPVTLRFAAPDTAVIEAGTGAS